MSAATVTAKARLVQAVSHADRHGLTHATVRVADLRSLLQPAEAAAPSSVSAPAGHDLGALGREYSIPPECVRSPE